MDKSFFAKETRTCGISFRKLGTSRHRDSIHECPPIVLCSPRYCAITRRVLEVLTFGVVSKGTFGETVSPEHQLHWIFENCKVVRAANGVSSIVEALKIAGRKHDLLWCVMVFLALHHLYQLFLQQYKRSAGRAPSRICAGPSRPYRRSVN